MKNPLLVLSFALLSACSQDRPSPQEVTPACREYQAMMTAPQPPDVHNRLKQACERSMNQK